MLTLKNTIFDGSSFVNSETAIGFVASKLIQSGLGVGKNACLTPKHVETKAVDCSTVKAVESTRRRQFKQEIISK